MRKFPNILLVVLLAAMLLAQGGAETTPSRAAPLQQAGSRAWQSGSPTAPAAVQRAAISQAAEAANTLRLGHRPTEGFLIENLVQDGDWAFGTITIPLPQ